LFYFNCEFHPTFDMSPGEDFYSDTYEKKKFEYILLAI
jgi:hypothetical protein